LKGIGEEKSCGTRTLGSRRAGITLVSQDWPGFKNCLYFRVGEKKRPETVRLGGEQRVSARKEANTGSHQWSDVLPSTPRERKRGFERLSKLKTRKPVGKHHIQGLPNPLTRFKTLVCIATTLNQKDRGLCKPLTQGGKKQITTAH